MFFSWKVVPGGSLSRGMYGIFLKMRTVIPVSLTAVGQGDIKITHCFEMLLHIEPYLSGEGFQGLKGVILQSLLYAEIIPFKNQKKYETDVKGIFSK